MVQQNMLRGAIRAATQSMQAYYEFSRSVGHSVEKGGFREFFVVQLIRPFIPSQFGIGSGVVVDGEGRESGQTDVIIYDRRLLPPMFLAGDRGIFPIDSVLAVVEVKSKLRAGDYKALLKAARRLSPRSDHNPEGMHIMTEGELPPIREGGPGRAYYPLYAVFAYEATARGQDERQRLQKHDPEGGEYIRLICALNKKGVWRFKEERDGSSVFYRCLYYTDSDGANIVETFMVLLLNRLGDTAYSRGKYCLEPWLPEALSNEQEVWQSTRH